ncbi:hypothetical protein [Aeromicrobium sp. UC242_57]|uniref:hypothetical protein n=1 Tax=Aeromicrobium sp. UC242_57 TaxID=3374624 RepID=UPI003787618A
MQDFQVIARPGPDLVFQASDLRLPARIWIDVNAAGGDDEQVDIALGAAVASAKDPNTEA